MTRENRFASVYKAGAASLVRTSRVARDAGSLIKGRSTSSSIGAVSERRPDPLVFAARFLFRRMRRPVDAEMPEVVETDGDRAAALIEGRVQIHAQARDGRSFDRIVRRGSTAPSRRCSASASAPVRNSHSARCSSSAKVSSCRRSQRPPATAPRRR